MLDFKVLLRLWNSKNLKPILKFIVGRFVYWKSINLNGQSKCEKITWASVEVCECNIQPSALTVALGLSNSDCLFKWFSTDTHTCTQTLTHKLNEIETIRSIDRFLFVVIVGGDADAAAAASTLIILYLALRLYSLVCTISTFISFNVSKCFENCFFKVRTMWFGRKRVYWNSSTTQIHIHIHIYVDIHINVSFGAAQLTIDNRLCMYAAVLMTIERSDICYPIGLVGNWFYLISTAISGQIIQLHIISCV